jgi:hypothetical protein
MFTIDGEDFGQIVFGNNNARNIAFTRESSMYFFKRMALLKSNIIANALGLYSFAQANPDGTVQFAHLKGPKFVLRPKTTGCVWDPIRGIVMQSNSFDSKPFEFQGEQCPDPFVGTCFEEFFGRTEKERESFVSTEQGRALLNQMILLVNKAIGNSYYDITQFGQNVAITIANADKTYTCTDQEWERYMLQQSTVAGHMTILDNLKQHGLDNMNVAINNDDISDDGNAYVGQTSELFDRLINAQNSEMLTMADNGTILGIIEVDPRIFDKYEKELQAKYETIPQMLYYYMNGAFCQIAGCDSTRAVPGILKYRGYAIVRKRDWQHFNTLIGQNIWRATLTAPGNYGVSYDILPGDQFGGFGLELEQTTSMKDRGLVYMSTRLRVGTGLIEPTFTINASKHITAA